VGSHLHSGREVHAKSQCRTDQQEEAQETAKFCDQKRPDRKLVDTKIKVVKEDTQGLGARTVRSIGEDVGATTRGVQKEGGSMPQDGTVQSGVMRKGETPSLIEWLALAARGTL